MRNRFDAGDLEVQDVCDEQGEDQLQGHGDEGVLEGDDQRLVIFLVWNAVM